MRTRSLHAVVGYFLLAAVLAVGTARADGEPAGRDKAEPPRIDSLWQWDDPEASELRFREAQESASGDLRLELQTQIARTYSLRRRFDRAHDILDDVQEQLADAGPRVRLRYLLERGRSFNGAGAREMALPLFHEAWEIGHSVGADDLAVDAAHMIAIAGDDEAAIDWNRQALELAGASDDPQAQRWKGSLLNNLSVAQGKLGRWDEALESARLCHDEYLASGDAANLRIARWLAAQAQRKLGQLDAALAAQLQLERELAAIDQPDGYVFEEIAEIHETRGDTAKATPYFRRAAELLAKDDAFAADEAERLARLQRLGERPLGD